MGHPVYPLVEDSVSLVFNYINTRVEAPVSLVFNYINTRVEASVSLVFNYIYARFKLLYPCCLTI